MGIFLKAAVLALTLGGAICASTSIANGNDFVIRTSDRGRDHGNASVSFNFGNVAFAYRDGYWDNDHRWHKWRNNREHRDYRDNHRDNYRDGYHRRYHGQGWQRD